MILIVGILILGIIIVAISLYEKEQDKNKPKK